MEALHATNITDNATVGPGIKFDANGQNTGVKCSAVQNRGGKQVTVAPKGGRQRQAGMADEAVSGPRVSRD